MLKVTRASTRIQLPLRALLSTQIPKEPLKAPAAPKQPIPVEPVRPGQPIPKEPIEPRPVVTPVAPIAPEPVPVANVGPKPRKGHYFRWGLLFGLITGIAWGAYDNDLIKLEDSQSVQPPTKCEPFPKEIELENTQFTCLGVGVRTVSFLKLHVYALGIYIANDDIDKAKTALIASGGNQNTLFDGEQSIEVVDALLAAGVRLAVRITPVRNTEFSHLRDGFVRSIMNHPMFKELNNESFGEGLGEIKRAFGRKRKAPKGDTIYMVRTATGELDAIYTSQKGETEVLGKVSDINVGRVFFLQYLSGKAPNSPSARDSAVNGLLEMAA